MLVLRGEAGAGKTALLEETLAAAAADGMQAARLTGVEAETQLGYAGLHRFLLPFAGQLEGLPVPQRDALRSTFGLAAGPPADRFLVGLAVLTLLAEVASQVPLVCVVDDVQWLDPESAVVLGFVARRLYAERVVLVFAVREPAGELPALAGLPELAVGGLDEAAALELLASLAPGRLSPAVGARIVAGTGGNPLALTEVARELSPASWRGRRRCPSRCRPAGRWSRCSAAGWAGWRRRRGCCWRWRRPSRPPRRRWCGGRPGSWASIRTRPPPADLGGLAEAGPRVEFRHPLVRSVVYYAAPLRQRRLIHQALAAAGDGSEPDRVAWHLGMAAAGPDEAVAARLEQAAGQVRDRGGYAATVTFLSRAAELSPDQGARARRLVAAAEAALIAGRPVQAAALLGEAAPLLAGPLARAQARRLDGTLRLALGQAGEAAPVLLEAARALAPGDPRGARQALLEALRAALYVGWTASRAVVLEIAAAARALPAAGGSEASAADLLLDGFAARAADGYRASVPLLRRAIAMLGADELSPQEGLRWLTLGCAAAAELFDDEAQHSLAIRMVQLARGQGALTMLPVALVNQALRAEVMAGRFDAARACFTEGSEISAATGNPGVVGTAGLAEVYELAWRGRETDTRRVAAAVTREAAGTGRGSHSMDAQYCLAVLELGLGNYQAALKCALDVYEDDNPDLGTHVLPDLVEAAVRCGQAGLAEAGLGRLSERAVACGTPLALGLLARSRALLAGDAAAEPLYAEAIAHLQQCRARPQLARAYLVYGEWLRRQRRRRDARHQLRTAHEMFTVDGRRGIRRTGPHRAAGHRRTGPPADRRDRNRAHGAGGADRPAGQPGGQQPGHRRAAVPQPLHRRLPPAESVP